MENKAPFQKLLTRKHHLLTGALTLAVFIFMSIALRPFAFSPDPFVAQFQASLTAVPITCVFWFVCNMFLIVLVDQRKRR
ncbi:MAG: hypothetical protein ACLFUF_06960 [Opitutales bacterium]